MNWIIEHWIPLAVLTAYLIGVGVLLHGFYTAKQEQQEDEPTKDCGGYWD